MPAHSGRWISSQHDQVILARPGLAARQISIKDLLGVSPRVSTISGDTHAKRARSKTFLPGHGHRSNTGSILCCGTHGAIQAHIERATIEHSTNQHMSVPSISYDALSGDTHAKRACSKTFFYGRSLPSSTRSVLRTRAYIILESSAQHPRPIRPFSREKSFFDHSNLMPASWIDRTTHELGSNPNGPKKPASSIEPHQESVLHFASSCRRHRVGNDAITQGYR